MTQCQRRCVALLGHACACNPAGAKHAPILAKSLRAVLLVLLASKRKLRRIKGLFFLKY